MISKTKFFLGADSDNGFISYFRQLQEQKSSMQLLILKGGPGSGKSSLMKRIADFAESRGHIIEIIPCASDPTSFDAMIDYTGNFAIMDGTAPHTEDPSIPGALHHIIYTGDLWDTEKLARKTDSICELSERISDCHKGAVSYIGAASALLRENLRYSGSFLKKDKLFSFVSELTGKTGTEKGGTERKRLLSAVSTGEIKLFSETPYSLADEIYIIEDSIGAAADFIMKELIHHAKSGGADFISCPCPVVSGKYDHIIFPKSRVAFLTGNGFLSFPRGTKIAADEFYERMPLEGEIKTRTEVAEKLLSEASSLIRKAKILHDDLEFYYKDAMDFSRMDEIFHSILKRFYRQ